MNTFTLSLNKYSTQLTLWAVEHPLYVQWGIVVISLGLALALSLLAQTSVYACPATSGSGGGGCGS
jgi:hypothetical protein